MLGLDLAIVDTRLRFFVNQSMIPTESELVSRLQRLVDEREDALSEAERQRADTLDQLSRVQVALARSVLELCRLRGLALTEDQRARVLSEPDAAALSTWAERAVTEDSADALFG